MSRIYKNIFCSHPCVLIWQQLSFSDPTWRSAFQQRHLFQHPACPIQQLILQESKKSMRKPSCGFKCGLWKLFVKIMLVLVVESCFPQNGGLSGGVWALAAESVCCNIQLFSFIQSEGCDCIKNNIVQTDPSKIWAQKYCLFAEITNHSFPEDKH